MIRALRNLAVVCLCCAGADAQQVSESMALEGRAAVVRAADLLQQSQAEAGHWNHSLPLTALNACALNAANPYLESNDIQIAVGKAIAWLRPQLKAMRPADLAWAVRPLIIAQDKADNPAINYALMTLAKNTPGGKTQSLWTADAMLLACHRLKTPPPQQAFRTLALNNDSGPSQQLALAIVTAQLTDEALKTLYAKARQQNVMNLSMESLYWLARAFQACNLTKTIPYDGWKEPIVETLLQKQRGDGSWTSQRNQVGIRTTPQALKDTALAIHVMIICLME